MTGVVVCGNRASTSGGELRSRIPLEVGCGSLSAFKMGAGELVTVPGREQGMLPGRGQNDRVGMWMDKQ